MVILNSDHLITGADYLNRFLSVLMNCTFDSHYYALQLLLNTPSLEVRVISRFVKLC